MAFTTEEITITAAADIRDGSPVEILERAILSYNEAQATNREDSRLFGDCLKVIDFSARTLWKPADIPIADAISQGLESFRDSVAAAVDRDDISGEQIAGIAKTIDDMEAVIVSIREAIDLGLWNQNDERLDGKD